MKIICDKTLLTAAVVNVSRAVATKSTILALEGILLRAKDNHLQLTGYDLELGISTTIEATVQEPGEIVLTARLFSDMIRRLPGDTVSISCDEKYLTVIRSGAAEYTILGIAPDEFPELPSVNDVASVSLPQDALKSMIDQTLFAVATTDSKPVHTGSLFDIKEGAITVVSVDGYRMAIRREKLAGEEANRFIIPGKTLSEVSKLMEDSGDPVELLVSRKHILFDIKGFTVVSRLLEGEFLDYAAAIPPSAKTTVTISTKQFIESIERTSLLISDRLRSPIRMQFGENAIQISCSTSLGKANDEIACQIEGESVEMGFNNKYLLDALRACGCDQVRLEIGGPLSPMKVVPLEGDSFLFLVLPVRLKSEG